MVVIVILAVVSRVFETRRWTMYSSVNLRWVSGTMNDWNSRSACRPRFERSTRNGVGVLDQPIRDVAGRERLAGPRGHLDQGSGAVLGEGTLEVLDGSLLGRPE